MFNILVAYFYAPCLYTLLYINMKINKERLFKIIPNVLIIVVFILFLYFVWLLELYKIIPEQVDIFFNWYWDLAIWNMRNIVKVKLLLFTCIIFGITIIFLAIKYIKNKKLDKSLLNLFIKLVIIIILINFLWFFCDLFVDLLSFLELSQWANLEFNTLYF